MEWLEADWPAPPWVRAISTTRRGGISLGPYAGLNLGDHVGDDVNAHQVEQPEHAGAGRPEMSGHHSIGGFDADTAPQRF